MIYSLFFICIVLYELNCLNKRILLKYFKQVTRLNNESELREAHASLFNENSKSGWLLLNFDVIPGTVHFVAGGEGGAAEVVPKLEDDQIQYLLIRAAVDDKVRDVFILWIGPGVGIIEKGKKTSHRADVEDFLQPFQASLTALSKANFNDETIIERSDPLSDNQVIE